MKERTQPTIAPEEILAALSQIEDPDLGRDRAGRPQLDPSCRRPEPKPTAADYAFWAKRFTPERIAEMAAALNSWRN
jgi:hypothetical protein